VAAWQNDSAWFRPPHPRIAYLDLTFCPSPQQVEAAAEALGIDPGRVVTIGPCVVLFDKSDRADWELTLRDEVMQFMNIFEEIAEHELGRSQ